VRGLNSLPHLSPSGAVAQWWVAALFGGPTNGDRKMKKAMKFKVKSPAHSAAIQRVLFELGFEWSTTGKKPTWLDAAYIYADGARLEFGNADAYFHGEEAQVVTLEQLCEMGQPKKLKVGTLSHKLVWGRENLTVGCQTLSHDDAEVIANWILEQRKQTAAA